MGDTYNIKIGKVSEGSTGVQIGASSEHSATSKPPTEGSALALWQEKLSRLLEAQVFEDDVTRQMKLERDIKAARAKIAEFTSVKGH